MLRQETPTPLDIPSTYAEVARDAYSRDAGTFGSMTHGSTTLAHGCLLGAHSSGSTVDCTGRPPCICGHTESTISTMRWSLRTATVTCDSLDDGVCPTPAVQMPTGGHAHGLACRRRGFASGADPGACPAVAATTGPHAYRQGLDRERGTSAKPIRASQSDAPRTAPPACCGLAATEPLRSRQRAHTGQDLTTRAGRLHL